jgi:hypothetical protein
VELKCANKFGALVPHTKTRTNAYIALFRYISVWQTFTQVSEERAAAISWVEDWRGCGRRDMGVGGRRTETQVLREPT